ncbi:transposase, partial [Thomasclavelia cocleata]
KTVSRNAVLDEFYAVVDENLSSEFGKELKKQRSIQAEGAFGVIKEDMKFTRFTRRGIEKVKMEYLLVCTGYNLKKYHKYRLRETKKQQIN